MRKKVLWVPDIQARKGVPISHLYWLAHYAMDKQPDRIGWAADIYDMPSLSHYDVKGSRASEGRRVWKDIDAGDEAMEIVQTIWAKAGYSPYQFLTLGNHENRWYKALENEPEKFEGRYPNDDPFAHLFTDYGIHVHKFLDVVKLDGIMYSHFFPHNNRGQIHQSNKGAPSALAQVQRLLCSATAGHQQGLDIGIMETQQGLARGLIAGSFYLHKERYIPGKQNYWRGLILKHEVFQGNYNLCEVSMDFLERKYRRLQPPGKKTL